MRLLDDLIREIRDDRIIQVNIAVLCQQTDGYADKAFADGIHPLQTVRCIGSPVALGDDGSVPHQNKAVHTETALF